MVSLLVTFSQLRDRFAISYVASVSSIFTIKPSQLPAKTQHTQNIYSHASADQMLSHVAAAAAN